MTSAQDNASFMDPHLTAAHTMPQDLRQVALEELPAMVGEGRIHWGEETLKAHASDETEDLVFLPEVVMERNPQAKCPPSSRGLTVMECLSRRPVHAQD